MAQGNVSKESVKKNDVQAPSNGAEAPFEKITLSRPVFVARLCKGPVQGIFTNIMGPLAAGKDAENQKPWFAYIVKLTAPCEVIDVTKNKARAEVGDEIMVPISAQLRNLAMYVNDEHKCFELRLEPGPQPEPRKMRTWDAAKGRTFERGTKYPLLRTGGAMANVLSLPPGDASDAGGEEIPF